jgi:hypothetical protein
MEPTSSTVTGYVPASFHVLQRDRLTAFRESLSGASSILPPDGCTICGKLSDDNPVYDFGFSVPFDNEIFDS